MFFGLFKHAPAIRYVALCDVANGSVGAALVRMSPEQKPELLFTFRTPLPYEVGTREVLPGLTEALTKASTALFYAITTHIPTGAAFEVRVFVHAPWCSTVTERTPLPFTRESVVTKKLLNTVTARALEDVVPDGMTCIDKHVRSIALNGYSVDNPIGKKARSATITVVRSFIESRIATVIQDTLLKQFPNHTIEMDAFVFALTQNKSLCPDNTDATIVDIGGLYTAITTIQGSEIMYTHVVPLGHRTIVAALSALYEDPVQADSQLGLYFNNAATPSQARKIEDALAQHENTAVRVLGDNLAHIVQQHGKVPHQVLLSVGTALAPWFEKLLGKIDFAQFTSTARPFEVVRIAAVPSAQDVRMLHGVKPDSMLMLAVHLLARERP